MKLRGWSFGMAGGVLGLLFTLAGVERAQAQDGLGPIETKLKASVIEAQSRFGELQPWQSLLYTDEVIPQYRRFVQDYKDTASGIQVSLDFESLKSYLFFFAPTFLKKPTPQIIVLVKTDPTCQVCKKVQPAIESLVRTRLEHRGFVPILVDSESIPFETNPFPIQAKLSDLSAQKKTDGTLLVYWAMASGEALEAAHADETHFILWSLLKVGALPVIERHQDIMETDQFVTTESRLFMDLLTDLGGKARQMAEQQARADLGGEELLLDVSGYGTFARYQTIRDQLQNELKLVATVEPRQFWKDKVAFVIESQKTMQELKEQIDRIGKDSHLTFNLRKSTE